MTALITGASRGLGKALAEIFAQHHYDLLITAHNEERLLQTAEELRTKYPSVTVNAQAFDLAEERSAKLCAGWAVHNTDVLDVVINNAGTFTPGNVSDEPEGSLEKMLSVNLYSAYHLTRGVLPKLKAQRSGHIFNICSIAGQQAYPGGGSYSISKFALIGFTKNLRHELKEHNIKVTAVIPGAIYTDSWKGSGVAEERIMQPQDLAQMVYAASQLSNAATVEEIVMRPQLGDL